MASKPAKYERIFPLGQQARRNIGEGRVLLGLMRRGELPQGTTLAQAREMGIDLSKRPRKGVRKKGLLPELTKKEYKEQLGKKIKDFSKEEKRIYNALAKRESRGYVVNRSADISLAEELEDFLMETDEEDEPPPPPPQDIDDILENLPTADEIPVALEKPLALEPPKEVVIPKGISSNVSMEIIDTDTDTDEEDIEDLQFESVLGVEEPPPPPKRPPRPSSKNPLLLSNKELREYTTDKSLSSSERNQRVLEVQLGYVRLDKDKAKREREAQKIRQRESRAKEIEEARQKKIQDAIQEERLEKQRIEAEAKLQDAIKVDNMIREMIEYNRQMDEEIQSGLYRKPQKNTRKTKEEIIEDLEEEDLDEAIDNALDDDELAQELEDFLEETPTPRQPTPSPTFQPQTPEGLYERFGGATPPLPTPEGTRLLFRSPKSRVKRTPPTRQQRVGVPINVRQSLEQAGVGNLSLGGATQRYRLRDFEVFPPNPDQQPSVLSQLVKNNRNRRTKK